jgi:hypothetical protein
VLDVLFLRNEGYTCSLDFLYEGLEIGKLQILIKKKREKKFQLYFVSIFGHQNPGSLYGSETGSGFESASGFT